jgi:hypothetical protein
LGVKPSPDFKQGFQIDVFSNKNLLGVREFASTAGAVIDSHEQRLRRLRHVAGVQGGQAADRQMHDVKPIVSKHGTNYQPVLVIMDGSIDRLNCLSRRSEEAMLRLLRCKPRPCRPRRRRSFLSDRSGAPLS